MKGHISVLACFYHLRDGIEAKAILGHLRLRALLHLNPQSYSYYLHVDSALTPPEVVSPFSSKAVHLEPGGDLSVSYGLSCDREKAHLQLSVLLSQFTSIWVLMQGYQGGTGLILSSGDAVFPSSLKHY